MRVFERGVVSFTVVREMNGLSDGRLENYAEGGPALEPAREKERARETTTTTRIIKAPCA